MSKWDTGQREKIIGNGTYWHNGVLTIDGTDARDVVLAGIKHGLCNLGVEVYRKDGQVINKRKIKAEV